MQGYHKMTSNGLRRPASSDSSNTIHKMWEILDQSFHLSLWHHFLSRGHLLILRRQEGGQPLFWEVLELVAGPNRESFKTSEVLKPFVIQGFQIFTSPNGKSGREQPLIWKWLRLFFFIYSYFYLSKKSKCLQVPPHPTLHKFADLRFESWDRVVGRPPSGNDSISGHITADKSSRDLRRVHICGDSDLSFWPFMIQSLSRLGVGSPCGKDTRLGKWKMKMFLRDVRSAWWGLFGMERDSRFEQLMMERSLSFVKKPNGKDVRDSPIAWVSAEEKLTNRTCK